MQKCEKTLVNFGAEFGPEQEQLLEKLYSSGAAGDYELQFAPELLIPVQRAFDRIINQHGIGPANFWFPWNTEAVS